jgi:hypothetical protein
VDVELTAVTGHSEPEAALRLLSREWGRRSGRFTMAADKGHDTRAFVVGARELSITSYVAQKKRYSAIDGRTIGWEGYGTSQRRRKLIEEWLRLDEGRGGLVRLRHRGLARMSPIFTFACAAHNLVRLPRLTAECAL